jgi:hydroxyacylglutathione hydrolase
MARKAKKPSNAPLILIGIGVLLFVVLLVYLAISGYNTGGADTGSASESTYPEIARVPLADAKAAYDAKSAVFVDVRGATDYQSSHIPGAISIPLGEIESRSNELNKDQWIITYCT